MRYDKVDSEEIIRRLKELIFRIDKILTSQINFKKEVNVVKKLPEFARKMSDKNFASLEYNFLTK